MESDMEDPKELNIDITLDDVYDAIESTNNIEFITNTEILNINSSNYMGHGKVFSAAPLNLPEEIIELLLHYAKNDLNSLILLGHVKGASITYAFWKEGKILIKFKF